MTPKRADANQPEIVAALRDAGASVLHLHEIGKDAPDLLVGFRGINYLMEVKNPNTPYDLTDGQKAWHEAWRGLPVVIVYGVDGALAAIGAIAPTAAREG